VSPDAAGTADPVPEPVDEIPRLVERFRLGSAASYQLAAPLADELIAAQRAGRPLAAIIVRTYTDLLYAATQSALGAADENPPGPLHALLTPDGRIDYDEEWTRSALVSMPDELSTEWTRRFTFNRFTLDPRGIHPHIHLAAAVRALAGLRSPVEAGGPADLGEVLDRAWFLLAFLLTLHLSDERMGDSGRALLVDVIACCARLHELSGTASPPAFVLAAVDRDLMVRHFAQEWVSRRKGVTDTGQLIDEGRHIYWDSGLPLPVGALLREGLGMTQTLPADPAAAMALGRRQAELGDFAGARAAFESARTHPDHSRQAHQLLHDLLAEESYRELVAILAQTSPEKGSPERTRVEEIGARLYLAGGMPFMRQVHSRFSTRLPRNARVLDVFWNGIGEWQG
jgi:hypothetical protein